MKFIRNFIGLIFLTSFICCNSRTPVNENNVDSLLKSKVEIHNPSYLTKFLGTWVSLKPGHVHIVEIKDSNNASVLIFDKWISLSDTSNKTKYAYYKSDGKLKVAYKYNLEIETSKFRFYYFLQEDTLFKMGEPGRVDTLLRVYNDSLIERK